jgi:hypothetical protein
MATMKLSEAIRMNGMMKPQGFGNKGFTSVDAPCALGGALQSIGRQRTDHPDYGAAREAWPWIDNFNGARDNKCPVPTCLHVDYPLAMIYHLNDTHKLTRAQIADWVELHEPQTAETAEPEVLAEVR